jgi:DNA repair ATPase RecN
MVNPKMMEAWFTLMAEAMRGTKEAQEAFQYLPKMSTNSEDLSHWLQKFMPVAGSNLQPEAFEEQLEEWWRMMGVVPRARYMELLEKNDQLQRRLEKAEETIQKLRKMMEKQGPQAEEAQQVLDTWNTMLQETLKTQTEWMRAWTANDPLSNKGEAQTSPAPDETKNQD